MNYVNLNDKHNTHESPKKILVNEHPKSEYQIYQNQSPLNTNESDIANSDHQPQPPDSQGNFIINNESIYGFTSDSQFIHSYNSFYSYPQKPKIKRSDSLISLSSQIDLTTIDNKVFSPIENSSFSISYNNINTPNNLNNSMERITINSNIASTRNLNNNTNNLTNINNKNLTLPKTNNLSYASRTSLHSSSSRRNSSKYLSNNSQETENILLPDVYPKKNKPTTKIKNFFSEKVFTSNSLKYKVKSNSTSSLNLIEELKQNKHNVKAISAKGTDLIVNNFNRISSKIV